VIFAGDAEAWENQGTWCRAKRLCPMSFEADGAITLLTGGTDMSWILFIVIGILAGWLAGRLTRGHGFGVLGDLIIGIVGALVGGFLFGILGLHAYGLIGSLVMATAGAVVLLYVVRLVKQM